MELIIRFCGRVLWVVHREDLLEQAALAFHKAAGLAEGRQGVSVRIVSGRHCTAGEILPSDDVLIVSAAALARHPEIFGALLDNPTTFLVIDEAHHGVAPFLRGSIERLRARPTRRLLGLTATPTRTVARERPTLAGLFGGRVLYEIGPAELIERGILARPIFVRADTRTTIDRGLSPEDMEHLRHFRDVGPAWLDRIARMEGRNGAIVDHYLRNSQRYGKTLIFATCIPHAILLTDRLRALSVSVDYVASSRQDGGDNRRVLDRFREGEGEGGLEVLVNVELLAEGSDFPAIRTVLLARPTLSEILLQQLIGRALRGPAVGGTDVAHVVSFGDRWSRADESRGVLERVEGLYAIEAPSRPGGGRDRGAGPIPPWETVEAVARGVRALRPAGAIESSESSVVSWFVAGGPDGAGRACPPIAVYSDQRDAYECAHASPGGAHGRRPGRA